MSLRAALIAALLGCAAVPGQAYAQHVVTDVEAAKLTLDSLTATPRPIYRPVVAYRRVHRPGYVTRAMHASSVSASRRRVGVHVSRR